MDVGRRIPLDDEQVERDAVAETPGGAGDLQRVAEGAEHVAIEPGAGFEVAGLQFEMIDHEVSEARGFRGTGSAASVPISRTRDWASRPSRPRSVALSFSKPAA